MGNTIRLMTHNVWNCDENQTAWKNNGEDCSAQARVGGVLRAYTETLPDIIGCQEMSAMMLDLLKEKCFEADINYTAIWGRFTPILYRADKFDLLDSAFGSYPENIDGLDGSFNDVRSKSWNIGVFKEKRSLKTFVFATTHLWWKSSDKEKLLTEPHAYQANSDEAREYQMNILAKRVKAFCDKYNCSAVVVGDFNTDYNSKAVKYMLSGGFVHAHDAASEFSDDKVGYHNCFPWGYDKFYSDAPFEKAIDHILLYGDIKNSVKRFERYSPEYYFPISDHSPAFIDVELQ